MIVVDSSFLNGFYNDQDAHHESARALMDDLLAGRWGKGLLLEYVFLEVVTVLLLRVKRAAATEVAVILLEAKELEFVPCSQFFSQTVAAFTNQVKTRLSFVDMAIAVVADSRTDGLVLSFDQEFRRTAVGSFGRITFVRFCREVFRVRIQAFDLLTHSRLCRTTRSTTSASSADSSRHWRKCVRYFVVPNAAAKSYSNRISQSAYAIGFTWM